MNRIFHHFSKWEDYHEGFYNSTCSNIDLHIKKSVDILSNQQEFYKFGVELINNWKYSCEQNLTDPSINKIAYIGQAACCIANGTPSFVTKKSWAYVSDENKLLANATSKKILNEWNKIQLEKGSLWQDLE